MTIYTQSISINKLKKSGGIYFKLKADANEVYTFNHYDRATKSYSISPVSDINKERFIKANKEVFIGFEY